MVNVPFVDELLTVPGAAPLRYQPGAPPSKSYVLVPEAMLYRCECGLVACETAINVWLAGKHSVRLRRRIQRMPSSSARLVRRRGSRPSGSVRSLK